MRCARAQAAAADDRCGRCCRWMLPCVVGGVGGPPFRTLPPFGLTVNYLPPPPPPPLPHPAALGPSRDELGDRQARAEKRQQQQQARRRRHRQRAIRCEAIGSSSLTPSSGNTLLPAAPAAAYPTPTHGTYVLVTRNCVPTTARPPGPRHHSDGLLLEIRWRICPHQSAVRLGTDYWTRKRTVLHINAINFASERASERTRAAQRHNSFITPRADRGL